MHELPFEIRSRAELIDALSVAASVEHAVLVQYLYAAFSCRATFDQSVPSRVQLASLRMARELYLISHDEMDHLGAVQQLLAALGAPPVPDTWPFPVAAPLEAQLTRLDGGAIARFVRAESPPVEHAELLIDAPDPVEFDFLGDLYRVILEGIRRLGDDAFVGATVAGNSEFLLGFKDRRVGNAEQALKSLATVVEEGEGATEMPATGHWARFQAMQDEHDALGGAAELLSWDCVPNPSVQPRQPGTTQLTHPFALQLGDVANRVYRALWLLLGGTYAFDWSSRDEAATISARQGLRRRYAVAARHLMATGIRPLGELMARLPAFENGGNQTGGFPFEQYEPFRIPTQPDARRVTLADELKLIANDIQVLSGADDSPPSARLRLTQVSRDIGAIRDRLLGNWPALTPRPRFEPPSPSGRFLTVDFQGYYQVRLATGGDPYADPRGISGWIFALPGEPELDRVIRLQPEGTTLRDHIDDNIRIGTFVSIARTPTGPIEDLAGASVDFLDSPVFEGHNGVLAGDGDEPIVPLHISVVGEGWHLERSAEDSYQAPFTNQTSLGQVTSPDSAKLRAELGVPVVRNEDFEPYVEATRARLAAAIQEALDQGDEDEAAVLAFRRRQIGRPAWTFGADVGWRLELTGSHTVVEQPNAALPISTTASWWIELLSTGYDPDAQTAVLRGVLHLPLTDEPHFPEWQLNFPTQSDEVMPLDALGLRPGR